MILDKLSYFYALLILTINSLVFIYSYFYFRNQIQLGKTDLKSAISFFFYFFVFTLLLLAVVFLDNLALEWIALELTTLVSAVMLGIYKHSKSLEAAWKYLILCSVGLIFALFGLVIFSISGINTPEHSIYSFNELQKAHYVFDPTLMKISFALVFIGFITKVGLAPVHNWLPDAHGSADAPLSAGMSAILLPVAFLPLLRIKLIADPSLPVDFTNNLFIFFGLLTLFFSALLLFNQTDFKRLLAYSSMENMGLIALAFGLSAESAGLEQILYHAFAKTLMFFLMGKVFLQYGSSQITKVKNLYKKLPITSAVIMFALVLLTGLPLSPILISKLEILYAMHNWSLPWMFCVIALCTIINCLLFYNFSQLVFSKQEPAPELNSLSFRRPFYFAIFTLLSVLLLWGFFPMDLEFLGVNL